MWGLYEEFSNGLDELAKEDWISFRYLGTRNLTKRLLSRHDLQLKLCSSRKSGPVMSPNLFDMASWLSSFLQKWVISPCKINNRPYICIIKKRLMSFAFENTPRISLTCMLVPVLYREYEHGVFCKINFAQCVSLYQSFNLQGQVPLSAGSLSL